MHDTQDIIYDVTGQSLVYDPPEGVPSSVTSVAVYAMTTGDDGTAEVATTGSASVDSVDTTFDATSGHGESNPRRCYLTATTNIAKGKSYLATNSEGETEWVRVVGIASADYVIAAEPLQNVYAAADTFEGARISISVDGTWVANSTNISDDNDPTPGYRVRWEYVVGGVTYVGQSYFNLVRYPFAHSVRPTDMLDFEPGWLENLPTYHREDNGQRILDAAFRDVRTDVYLSGHAAEMIRDQQVIDDLVLRKARELLWRLSTNEGMQAYTTSEYNALLDGAVRIVTRVRESSDTSGAGADTVAKALWSK